MDTEDSKCAWCNKETAMAGFGILLGLAILAMSIDIIRRGRMSIVDKDPGWNPEHYEVINDD